MADEPVLLETRDRVRILTINRPRVRNALDPATLTILSDAIEAASDDDSIGALVLEGAGDACFCAGMDLRSVRTGDASVGEVVGRFHRALRSPVRVPIVAAVRGLAVGGGFELMTSCDLAVAAEDARFALPEVTRGLVLPPHLIRQPDDRGVEHCRMAEQHVLDLGRGDVLAAPDDRVIGPALDEQVTLLVQPPGVSGGEPAGGVGGGRSAGIRARHLLTADPDISGRPRLPRRPPLVSNLHLHSWQQLADRAQPARYLRVIRVKCCPVVVGAPDVRKLAYRRPVACGFVSTKTCGN